MNAGGRRGFSLVEILVAIAVSTMLFGICVAIYIKASTFKSRSEQLLYLYEKSRGITDRLARDLEGLHVADSDDDGTVKLIDYWELEKEPVAGCSGDRLTFLSATENPGRTDCCTVRYYAEDGKLYRELSDLKGGVAPAGGWPAKPASVLAEGVERLTVSTVPPEPAAGKLPASITITLQLADPDGQPTYRRFTVTLRPGPEEN